MLLFARPLPTRFPAGKGSNAGDGTLWSSSPKLSRVPALTDRTTCPYRQLPGTAFWSKAVVGHESDLDPIVDSSFQISQTDRIVTAGSCFAQHIARRLQRSGYGYFVAEDIPLRLPDGLAEDFGYRMFSARYGNVYTSRQLVQLIDRAYGRFEPQEPFGLTNTVASSTPSVLAFNRLASATSTRPSLIDSSTLPLFGGSVRKVTSSSSPWV